MLRSSLCMLFLLGIFYSSFACECKLPASNEEALKASTFAFVGTCIQLNTNWMSGGMKYSFNVEKSWKGGTDKFMIVNAPFVNECGGMKFEVGKRYLVFVDKKFSPKTNRCLGTHEANPAEIEALGEGLEPQPSSLVQLMIWTISGLVFTFLLIVLFVVLKKNKE